MLPYHHWPCVIALSAIKNYLWLLQVRGRILQISVLWRNNFVYRVLVRVMRVPLRTPDTMFLARVGVFKVLLLDMPGVLHKQIYRRAVLVLTTQIVFDQLCSIFRLAVHVPWFISSLQDILEIKNSISSVNF